MAADAIAYTYRYPFPSSLDAADDGARLRLATCTRADEHPHFFAGIPRQPYLFGKMLLVLSDVVRTRFYDPERWRVLLDPVVTASESMLRFEGFSSCCGVYVRADLRAEFFDTEITGRGTTNVDFNDPMRAALNRLRDTDSVRLAVGRDEVALERSGETTVEKKVKLPVRWLKGFGEVQTYQATLEPRIEAPAAEALRFVRTLPTSSGLRRPAFVVQNGRSLRLSPRERPGTVRLAGTHRARVIESLLPGARTLRLWADDGAGVTAWEVIHDNARIVLVLSPEIHRGFSGEGQLLELLAGGTWRDLARSVRARLHWQTHIDGDALAAELDVPVERVHDALAALGASGLAGYDLDAGA
ncbi:MAG: SWIM zinc finger family protein [Acidobacteriota bacterium]